MGTVVVVFCFTRFQGARPALAKHEFYWYLPNRVREILTLEGGSCRALVLIFRPVTEAVDVIYPPTISLLHSHTLHMK